MIRTRVRGLCVGDLRLATIDVGFDPRLQGMAVQLPQQFGSVGLDIDGETYLLQGTRDELIAAIRAAGYRIAEDV